MIEAMKAVERGEATRDGENGADYILFARENFLIIIFQERRR